MKFQLERIALFSDAVFAIAITLMMIEVKPPHLEHGTSFGMALIKLLQLIPTFIGTILSFFMIGIFWKRHHQLMKYMAAYNEKVIML
ncbi:MAG: TMEM175 family protein, partial [Bacteroidia bacterium]